MEVNTRMIRGFVWNIQSTLCLPSLIKVHFYCSSIVRVLTIMFSFMFSNSPLLWHFFPAFIIAWKAQKIVISIWCRKMDGVFVFVFLFLYEVNSIESLCSLDIVLLCSLETICNVTFILLEKVWLSQMIWFNRYYLRLTGSEGSFIDKLKYIVAFIKMDHHYDHTILPLQSHYKFIVWL